MFHLTTHAFFKALLFLGAGSVIIALHHEQNIWQMGGLRKRLPVTFWTFICGTVAIAGIIPFSGFYSKDAILAVAVKHEAYARFALGIVVATLTAFYMFRLVFVVFGATERSESASHAKESPPVMIFPLRILAVLSVIGGFIGVENVLSKQFKPSGESHTLTPVQELVAPFVHTPWAAAFGLLAGLGGAVLAYQLYRHASKDPLPEKLGVFARWMRNRFYFDELYEATVIRVHDSLAVVADWIDRWLIAGVAVRGSHGTTELIGRALRLFQTGNLQTYAFLFVLGVAFLLYFVLK